MQARYVSLQFDTDIDISFTFHESTITINRIKNMSRVIQVINVQNQRKMIPSQIHDDVQYR